MSGYNLPIQDNGAQPAP